MPEQPEVRLMGDFIEKSVLGKEFVDFAYGDDIPYKKWKNWKPNLRILHPFNSYFYYEIWPHTSGKELLLNFRLNPCDWGGCMHHVVFNMGMTGSWLWGKYDTLRLDRHNKLFFIDREGDCLCFRDPRKFGTWKQMKDQFDFSPNRGTDPVLEHQEFINHIYQLIAKNHKSTYKSLLEVMLDQYVFNGVGNYLRAEILDRFDVNPLVNLQYLNYQSGQIIRLCELTKQLCEESYALGGGQIKDFVSPTGQDPQAFKNWLQCYGKKESLVDSTGRRFWYDSKWNDFLKNTKYMKQ